MKRQLIGVLGLFFVLGLGCASADPSTQGERVGEVSDGITNFGAGVYYFNHGSGFGKELASFREEHPELVVVSVVGYDATGYGNNGYYVIVESNVECPECEECSSPATIQAP